METAVQCHDQLNLANTLAVIAFLDATKNNTAAVLELFTLAQQNPFIANSRWISDVVGGQITAVTRTLSPEAIAAAQAKGKTFDMWQTAEKLHNKID